MTDPNQPQTPPAWYPDPDPNNPGGQRWWDGTRWTQHSRPAAPSTPPPYDRLTSSRQGQPAYAQPGTGYAQPVTDEYPRVPLGTSAVTWSVWLVLALPLLPTIAYLFLDFDSYFRMILSARASGGNPGPGALSPSLTGFVVVVLLIDLLGLIVYGLTVMFAYFDWRELGRRGFARPFHWAWAFLGSLVYVIGRVVVTHRRGGYGAMIPIWGLIAAIAIGILIFIVKVMMIVNSIGSYVSYYGGNLS